MNLNEIDDLKQKLVLLSVTEAQRDYIVSLMNLSYVRGLRTGIDSLTSSIKKSIGEDAFKIS